MVLKINLNRWLAHSVSLVFLGDSIIANIAFISFECYTFYQV